MKISLLVGPALLITAARLAPLPSGAEGHGELQRPLRPIGSWRESWDPSPRVSGALVPGLMVGDQAALYPGERITVRLPPHGAPAVCVTITGRDGQFHANALFRPGEMRGAVLLQGPAQHRGRLQGHRAEDIALVAEAGRSCSDPGRVRIAANWGSTFHGGDVYLYVNARQHTSVAWDGRNGEPLSAQCGESDGERNVSYNRVCRIPAERIADRSRLTILRQRDGRTVVRDTLVLDYPQ